MEYVYSPLASARHEFRLLKLRPAKSRDDPLKIVFLTASFDGYIPEYETVSYAWGRPNRTFAVFVEEYGTAEELPSIPVTMNLDIVLRHLRCDDMDRLIWVDALCINQNDTAERSSQVQQMRRIYECCVTDLAWLGPNAPQSLAAIPKSDSESDIERANLYQKFDREHNEDLRTGLRLMKLISGHDIRAISKTVGRSRHNEYVYASKEEERMDKLEYKDADGDNDDDRKLDGRGKGWKFDDHQTIVLMTTFSTCDLWRRVWVMQELSCAPRVVLVVGKDDKDGKDGKDNDHDDTHVEPSRRVLTLDWDSHFPGFLGYETYADAFHCTFGHGFVAPVMDKVFNKVKDIEQQRNMMRTQRRGVPLEHPAYRSNSLIDVLARFSWTRSSDPRDKVYGLMGLAAGGTDMPLVDYTKTPATIYAEAALDILQSCGNLDIICQNPFLKDTEETDGSSQALSNRVPGLPSWVPNFDRDESERLGHRDALGIDLESETDLTTGILFAQRGIYAAGRPSFSLAASSTSRIHLRGAAVGRLTQVHSKPWARFWWSPSPDAIFDRIREWQGLLGIETEPGPEAEQPGPEAEQPGPEAEPGADYFTGEPLSQAFWRTIAGDCVARPNRRMTDDEVASTVSIWNGSMREEAPPKQMVDEEMPCWDMVQRMLKYWVLARGGRTETDETRAEVVDGSVKRQQQDLLLMVRRAAQAGDVVAVLDGGKVPMVLRPTVEDGAQAYRVVCAAYVHGYMDGEAVEEVERGERQEQEFVVI